MYIVPNIQAWYNQDNKRGGVTMPASKAQQKAVSKYMKDNYDEIKIRIPKGQKKVVQAYAQENGQSVNALIWKLLQDAMGVDKTAKAAEDL
jgi:hypothetical protein